MLNVERKIILNSDYINKDIYLGENVISEGLISFIKTGSNNTCYMGFMDSLGNEVIEAKYTDVSLMALHGYIMIILCLYL